MRVSHKKEASIAAAQIDANLAQGVNIPFAQYFLKWYQTYKKDVSAITLNSYQAAYNKILSYFKETPLQKITKRDYQNFLNDFGETNAKVTNRKFNGYIPTCLKEAIVEELIKKDFTRNVTGTGSFYRRKEGLSRQSRFS